MKMQPDREQAREVIKTCMEETKRLFAGGAAESKEMVLNQIAYADALFLLGEYDKGLDVLKWVRSRLSEQTAEVTGEVYAYMGIAYEQKGEEDMAFSFYRSAFHQEGGEAMESSALRQAALNLAKMYLRRRQIMEAQALTDALLEKLSQEAPSAMLAEALTIQGNIHCDGQDFMVARGFYQEAAAVYENLTDAGFNYVLLLHAAAECLFNAGQVSRAAGEEARVMELAQKLCPEETYFIKRCRFLTVLWGSSE